MTTIRVIDFETTGFPPKASVVEVGWTDVTISACDIDISDTHAMLVNPGRPIPPEATAIHGITNQMIAGAPRLPGFGIRSTISSK